MDDVGLYGCGDSSADRQEYLKAEEAEVRGSLRTEDDPEKRSELEDRLAHLRRRRQEDEETEAIELAREEYEKIRENITKMGKATSLEPEKKLLVAWYAPLRRKIEDLQMGVEEFGPGATKLSSKLKALDAGQLAVIVMHNVMSSMSAGQVPTTDLALVRD